MTTVRDADLLARFGFTTQPLDVAVYMKKRNWYGALPRPGIRFITRARTFA